MNKKQRPKFDLLGKPIVYRCDKLKHGIFCTKDEGHAGPCEQAYVHIPFSGDDRSPYGPE